MNFNINHSTPMFKGRREDRKVVQQLSQDNDYSLTENNQIRINKAIDNLAKEQGEGNVKFLLDVADGLKYGTNIDLGKEPKNNWKEKLHSAARSSLEMSNPITQEKYAPDMKRVFTEPKPLSGDEKDILTSRANILSKIDKTQLETQKNSNIKNVESNLDYFIASSETPTKQKKYILNRLDYFMSPEYHINPQLEDKKTLVLAEMVNDIVVNTKESQTPNTKAVNQKQHGMCAAISIARKLAAYEYKPQYVDSVMSELDDSPHVMVYDRTRLSQGAKIPVDKANVDFDDALAKGYRVVDASTTQWMNIGDMYGADNKSQATYVPFDSENFDTSKDNHFMNPIEDKEFASKHQYYQGLMLANDAIKSVKADKLEKQLKRENQSQTREKDIKYLQDSHKLMKTGLKDIVPSMSDKEAHSTLSKLLKLESKSSMDINKVKDGTAKYHFLPNEESSMKDKKVKAFIADSFKGKVDEDKLNQKAPQLRILIESSNSVESGLSSSKSRGAKLSAARGLYEAAAAYRNANLVSLNDKGYLQDKMIKYNVPDAESLLLKNIDDTIKHVEKTGDKTYVNHFARTYGLEPDKTQVLETLNVAKESITQTTFDYLDEAYRSLGLGNRKEALQKEVAGIKMSIQAGDKDMLKGAAFSLGLKGDDKAKVLKEYDKFDETLKNGATDKQYTEIFNKMGYKDQLQAFADSFVLVNDAFNNPDIEVNKAIIGSFNEANGIEGDEVTQESKKQLNNIGNTFNALSQNFSFIRSSMEVTNDKGHLINSAHPYDVVVDKMEKQGDIVTGVELKTLQNHFNRVDKLRSQDEFSSRQGKLSDPTLYNFSKQEKATLKKIDKSINKMYSEVNKEMAFVMSEIRKPLEEHARKTGVETGRFWVNQIGSGLSSQQEVKIIEMITDKKYRATENFEKAVDKIKTNEHSGVSSTSVFHDRVGGHAQYIAEISPLNGKDVLYHDNSWGASENENTWIDSESVRRTDYSDKRGGETGYITNDEYRNGNYVEDLMYNGGHVAPKTYQSKELKKLKGDSSDFKFSMVWDVIMTGNDGKIKDVAQSMKYSIFQPDSVHLESLAKVASNMTQDELKSGFIRRKTSAADYKQQIKKLDERIETTPFNKGIDSQADYDSLPNNDFVKVAFEKAAIKNSFPNGVDWKELAQADTVEKVHSFRAERDKVAQSYFDYSFGKEKEVLYAYAQDTKQNKTLDIINSALDNHGIKLDDKQKTAILKNTAVYDKSESEQFDGSLKNTIGFMVGKTLKQFDGVVPDSENARLAKQEIKENLTKSLSDALYFNESDVNNSSTKFTAISKYIDKKYNPETDADFAKIYRNLQDMTTEEFRKETSDVKPEDLGIKEYSGYEMLKRYKASNSKVEDSVHNSVRQQLLLKDLKLSKTEPVYKYNKLYKKSDGMTYKGDRTFDDLYLDLNNSVGRLDYAKMFNKYKGKNWKTHKVMPAYPMVTSPSEQLFDKKQAIIDETVFQYTNQIKTAKNTLKAYNLTDRLVENINKIPNDAKPTKKQAEKINILAGQFLSDSFEDPNVQKSVTSALMVLSLDKNAKGADYKAAVSGLDEEFSALKKVNPPETLKSGVKAANYVLGENLEILIKADISERYQNKLREDAHNWIKEIAKPAAASVDIMPDMEKLSTKIDSYALPKKNFGLTKSVYLDDLDTDISKLAITKTAILNADEKTKGAYTKSFNKQVEKMNTSAQKFVYGNIQPEYQSSVMKSINELVNKGVKGNKSPYDEEKVLDARDKFFEDYKQHGVLNSPEELLDRYLLLNAKDSPVNSTDKRVASHAQQELLVKQTGLESVLNTSALAEMQELLMEAVETGNVTQLPEEFNNIQTGLFDPKTNTLLTMGHHKSIDYVVRSLILGDDDSTAVMFVDKLGLADKFIKAQNEIINFDVAKKEVRKIANIIGVTSRQADIVNTEVNKIATPELESDENFAEKIDAAKENIIAKTKNMPRKKAVKTYLKSLDDSKAIIAANPGISKNAILSQMVSSANVAAGEEANNDVAALQTTLKYVDSMHSFINRLNIPEYSPAVQEKEKFNAKYDDFEDYNNKVLSTQLAKTSEYMQVTTEDN